VREFIEKRMNLMATLYKIIVAIGLLGLMSACAYDPAARGYYSSSNRYYGQGGYRQNSSYGNPGYGYSSYGNYGYPQPAYGYGNSGYQQPIYGYSGYQQRTYCPDDDDDD
jgi:hypothetical protein